MTKIITQDKIDEAAKCLSDGGIVAFPTETVYGLGCDAMNVTAIDKVYKAKGRPSDNPLIIHISSLDDMYKLVSTVTAETLEITKAFWPGPLTVILPKASAVPYRVTGGLDTVAVRCPADAIANELIFKSGKFIAAPSANLSGSPSPTTSKHVIDDLDGRVDYILCGDNSQIGLESTVVDLSGDKPLILRPGAITLEMLSQYLPDISYDIGLSTDMQKPKSPGMKYKHYSPKAEIEVVTGQRQEIYKYISERLNTESDAGVLVYFNGDYDGARCVLKAGNTMEEYAAKLFYNLRVFDEYMVQKIYVEFTEEDGIGVAVKNRLYKAAGNNITRV